MLGRTRTADLVSAAHEAAAVAARHASAGPAATRLDPEVVDAIVRAGFVRHFVPKRWGGNAGTFTDLTRGSAVLGEGCASAAWCAGVLAAVSWTVGAFPERGQQEIWGSGPDTVVAGAVSPAGTVARDADGWRLSGEWGYISGLDFCDWVLLIVQPPGDESRFFAVPRAEILVRDTWRSTGMRRTGSNTAVLDGAFVPDHLSFGQGGLAAALGGDGVEPHLRVSPRAVGGLWFTAPLLGAAREALRTWSVRIRTKVEPGGGAAGDNLAVQMAHARSSAELDAAGLLLERAARLADDAALEPLDEIRNVRDYAIAAELVVAAVDRVLKHSGTSGHVEGAALERVWRDVHSAASHTALRFDRAAAAYSRTVLGSPERARAER